ncbi:hemerythrin family protein [Muricomes sp. OA1]|uniref:Hemerythrin n=2 Tax=Lachnospiraceae TaxID=186803 RepID=A0A3E2WYL3_9FIRM|nr:MULTISPECIES: hemerythrin family protein [Clostridia]MCH1972910.1 hemerythrin family protein [Muricomes sp. OA1]RGC32750.1 hemerythrin [Hungatella hathewayi]GKH31681.1 hemerythrin [Faecalicatena contorta]
MRAEFDDSLVTGNDMIDSQHKELIDKINKLLESCESGKDKLVAIKTLDYLADYTDFHFSAEEKLQEEIEYPGIKEHKKEHEKLRTVVKELYEMLEEEEGPSNAFVEQVNKNVIEWLYRHIKGFDRSVAEYKFMAANSERL